jgi:REP element-mobilizing transposase RayT
MGVLGFHVIFGAYGFWLPNDPRGSWSDFVGSWELFRFGKATKTNTRRSVSHVPHDQQRRKAAKQALKHPPVAFTGIQARGVGRGFGQAVHDSGYAIHACSILPEHVHLVVGANRRSIGRIVGHLKGEATNRLYEEGLWTSGRPVWGGRKWKVYLYTAEEMLRAIAYVEQNPLREGKPRQRWSFVTPWPLPCS